MKIINFKQVDVFTSIPFKGNPVAVIMDAKGLSDQDMQNIANWLNLSETTFVFPAENNKANYKIRIFTPEKELPFAGHPTIGTAHALIESGIIKVNNGYVVQECNAGLVHIFVSENKLKKQIISFELPEETITLLTDEQINDLEMILNCPIDRSFRPALVDIGARWIVTRTHDCSNVLTAKPDYQQLKLHDEKMNINGICLYSEYPNTNSLNIEVRSFAPSCGVNEDPVCGSGNACVALFMRHHSVCLPDNGIIHSSQGKVLGRDGKIQLNMNKRNILVGGESITCISGKINL